MKCVYIFPSTLASALGLTAPGPTYDYGYYRCTPIVIKLHGWWFYARPCFLLPLWLLTLFVVPFLSFLLPFSLSLSLSHSIHSPISSHFFFIIGLGSHIATPCRCCCRSLLAATHNNFSLHLLLWIHFSFHLTDQEPAHNAFLTSLDALALALVSLHAFSNLNWSDRFHVCFTPNLVSAVKSLLSCHPLISWRAPVCLCIYKY